MSESNYTPSGELQGKNTGPLPDRGTSTGMGDNAQTEGMSLQPEAINRMGALKGTESDPPGECKSDDPTFAGSGSDPDDKRGYA